MRLEINSMLSYGDLCNFVEVVNSYMKAGSCLELEMDNRKAYLKLRLESEL